MTRRVRSIAKELKMVHRIGGELICHHCHCSAWPMAVPIEEIQQ